MAKIEELKDIDDAIHMEHEYGERFRGWYFFKNFIEKKSIPLNYRDTDLSYRFNIYEHIYNFVIPIKIEFCEGIITYTNAERRLGLFRFPRDENGNFVAPFPVEKIEAEIKSLSEEEVERLIKAENPLVFEAFRIPIFGFKLFGFNEHDMKEISDITDEDFVTSVKKEHDKVIKEKVEEIKKKILSLPNYLLILKNVLNRQWKDLGDLATATGGIIHI